MSNRFIVIHDTDQMADLPKTYNANSEKLTAMIEEIEQRLSHIAADVSDLKQKVANIERRDWP